MQLQSRIAVFSLMCCTGHIRHNVRYSWCPSWVPQNVALFTVKWDSLRCRLATSQGYFTNGLGRAYSSTVRAEDS